MSRDIVRVHPSRIQWRISADLKRDRIDHALWREAQRFRVTDTFKYQSIVRRYVEGQLWEETPLFTDIYAARFESERSVRGCESVKALAEQYYDRVDAMFEDMKANGFQRVINGRETAPIPVYLGHDGELLLGNQGNHRLPMAQVLELPYVIVEIVARHPESPRVEFEPNTLGPNLPECVQTIPAMTTEAERTCYYRLTKAQAPHGEIVELGPWLGASTAYIAAGIRDSGVSRKAQVYDRFVWKPASHDKKAGGPIRMSQLEAFRQNLGPLLQYVDVHASELRQLKWTGDKVSLLVCDAPKRIAEISIVLSVFAKAMQAGSVMAWQDFGYFPSYDIPAALMRLSVGGHVELTEAVYPGTTAVFRVTRPWSAKDVSQTALSLKTWKADDVEVAWDMWAERLPAPMRPRFLCGAAMFLCDLGATERAQRRLSAIIAAHPDEVLPKWEYLIRERANLMQRYQPLVEVLQPCA